jgi:hypothetical protein
MIIASIIEVARLITGQQESTMNGASSVIFYTWDDAVTWARIQSEDVVYGTNSYNARCLVICINTDTEERRWWYNGVEYTG